MTDTTKRKWHLIRDNIKFQIKLTLDAVRDLLLSPVAIICTILDLLKGNNTNQGYFQRLMQMGHATDHWLNLFGDVPTKETATAAEQVVSSIDSNEASIQQANDNSTFSDNNDRVPNRVDNKLDNLFGKIEGLLEEQQQKGGLTTAAKDKIEHYLTVLNSTQYGEKSTLKQNSSREKDISK
jgi:hypothetical protein